MSLILLLVGSSPPSESRVARCEAIGQLCLAGNEISPAATERAVAVVQEVAAAQGRSIDLRLPVAAPSASSIVWGT